ncbi:Gfo/Idh/MocA family protein [Stenomitos frigidus]|uniref:Glycosyl transferase family 2 n=1 Tax=Stenomitos frigidus ULC18 TaxID=2107698 RepID=A0A2T1E6H1_9CYAN|nr:Gfo/Idh/MocA family oxidoreductase [Stenomitos frigidus]PSB28275.1 glycosyl transferase family 2 [Stenomitos frigidus ULC18]
MTKTPLSFSLPLQVGLVGTGYAAKLRSQALQVEPRATLTAVAGHTFESTEAFSQTYGAEPIASWTELVQRSALDVIIIATVNRDHGAIVRAALEAGKHVIVEYPLALDVTEATALIALAKAQDKLLHVEHIELLGNMHQALKTSLPAIGKPFFARYATIKPENPAPQRWTYHPELFGFPLVGALSRLHRLIDLFGTVVTVSCQSQFGDRAEAAPYYATCYCTAQLRFQSGLLAEVVYAKGEAIWQSERKMAVHGDKGALIFDGDQGTLVQADGSEPIALGSRRGLFTKDTAMVLDYLIYGKPLYVTPETSLYTLKVADAARRSAESGQTVKL